MPLDQRNEVVYTELATELTNDLVSILYEENYFGFLESALDYVTKMKIFTDQNINILPHLTAPEYFSKYQSGMKYIAYQANKRTTWYIFFKQFENRFLIYYITNNHFEGQYIR